MKQIFEELLQFVIDEVGHGLFASAKSNMQTILASICYAIGAAVLYNPSSCINFHADRQETA
jgi:hypothetical protein